MATFSKSTSFLLKCLEHQCFDKVHILHFFLDRLLNCREGEAEARVLADPSWEEEELAGASLSVVSLQGGQVCHIRQPGGRPVSQLCLSNCLDGAKQQAELVISAIDKMVKK